MRSSQELFDLVVTHLRNQKQKSHLSEGDGKWYQCLYRSPEGHKCAIGCLIPDEVYKPSFEQRSLERLLKEDVLPKTLQQEFSENLHMLDSLQTLHDQFPINEWEMRLRALAYVYGLEFKDK